MTRREILPALLLYVFLAAPALADPPRTAGGSKFLRYVGTPQAGVLESSIVRYRNADDITVDLIGAVHIGEVAYFDALEKQFATYDALLYELVKPIDAAPPGAKPPTTPSTAPAFRPGVQLRAVGGLQRFLKETLELSFQLEEIDYTKANFVHADLDAETFTRLQDERNESFLTLMLRAMMQGARNPQLAAAGPSLPELLEAMAAPDRDRRLKLLLARQFSNLDLHTQLLEGSGGSVILTERNRRAVQVMDQQIEAGKTSLGIFYGAAHLPGIEAMLRERGFEQVGEPQWIVAWDMSDAKR
jgi:hypothetical protein